MESASGIWQLAASGVYQWDGVERRISHDSRNGGSFFLPGNDNLCVHMHSAAARREYGVGFSQFTWGVRRYCLPQKKS